VGATRGEGRRAATVERLKEFLRRMPYVSGFVDESYIEVAAEAIYDDIASEYDTGTTVDDGELGERVRLLVDEMRRQAAATRSVLDGICGFVDVSRARSAAPRVDPNFKPWARHPGIRKAIGHIMDHYGERITNEDLAAAACLSKSHFMTAFKAETGMTPHEFLRRARIESAMRLLAEGMEVTEVAFSIGFSSLSGFESAFADLAGMSPGEFAGKAKRRPAGDREPRRARKTGI
jgi:AraC-like DNA-binding protein